MALRALNTVVVANYNKLVADSVLAGDLVGLSGTTGATSVNPVCVSRVTRDASTVRASVWGVAGDDGSTTETPTMISNDPVGSNFLNNGFLTYTNGFYVGAKRTIGEFRDESISTVTNLTESPLTVSRRGMSVHVTPGSQFITDRFALLSTSSTTADAGAAWAPAPGDVMTVGASGSAGRLVRLASAAHGPAVGRVDFYDAGAGLLYWTLL